MKDNKSPLANLIDKILDASVPMIILGILILAELIFNIKVIFSDGFDINYLKVIGLFDFMAMYFPIIALILYILIIALKKINIYTFLLVLFFVLANPVIYIAIGFSFLSFLY